MDSSNARAAMSKAVKEDSDGVEIDSTGGTEDRLSEATIDADTLENGIDEAAMDTGSNLLSEENEKEEDQPSHTKTGAEVTKGTRKLQIQGKWRGVDPVLFHRDDTDRIMEFYGIKDSFPFKGVSSTPFEGGLGKKDSFSRQLTRALLFGNTPPDQVRRHYKRKRLKKGFSQLVGSDSHIPRINLESS
ncbi:unnamed protein product [Fraxinus pennsylvanica]|uniref:Uncharacterized protein n=1 Tax=Fraxinus pennsylvanica TaxID=56036 RepID=A0AAD1YN40_9LAMI|nr:unnamed protein product [Fraxinus pennsylvanica]